MSEITADLKKLAETGRALKNERLQYGGDSKDDLGLMPQVHLSRFGKSVALIGLIGDRDRAHLGLEIAIRGYGADEVTAIFDVYVKEGEMDPDHESLQAMKESDDPLARASVTEALNCMQFKLIGSDEVDFKCVFAPYTFDPKKRKFRWGVLSTPDSAQEMSGGLYSRIKGALTAESAMSFVNRQAGPLPPEVDGRFAADQVISDFLVMQGHLVAYHCEEDKVDKLEANARAAGITTERLT